MRADLHIHTDASDSCWSVERVVAGVQALGVGLFAVADHDTVASVPQAAALAQAAGLRFLPAVEISTLHPWEGNHGDGNGERLLLHVLGYGIDVADEGLSALLRENRARMEAYDAANIRALIEMGYPLDYQAYLTYEAPRGRGGWDSLNFLIDQGVCRDARHFLSELLPQLPGGWPDFVSPDAAVSVIRAAGGVPVLAHPGASLPGGVTEAGLDVLPGLGIGGVECYSQYHDPADTALCVAWSQRHGMLITGGSDYHGGFVGRQLGVPEVYVEQLELGELCRG